ncbi:MAG: FmdB family transcriptional regulator [Acidobacteria bacterium]|nr:FmdB family transcriptional regulator [Acidobacteriota bacterium]
MPTYEYACLSCGERTEVVRSFSDPPLTVCPRCDGELKRLFHPVGIVLKGSGFYSTDNRASKRRAPKEPAAKTGTETKTETKTESTQKAGATEPKPKKSGTDSSTERGSAAS